MTDAPLRTGAFFGMLLSICAIVLPSAGCHPAPQEIGATSAPRDYVLMFLAQPQFSGESFEEQILGTADLELYDLGTRQVYFSLPDTSRERLAAVIAKFTIDPAQVEMATEHDGVLTLGEYSLPKSPEKGCFFRIAAENFKVDSSAKLRFRFDGGTYTLEIPELIEFAENRSVYGGSLETYTEERRNGKYVVFANHGAFVARKGERSLVRFVAELTRDIPGDDPFARERRVQRLLDFVTSEIDYDMSEASYDVETLKRASEVLMTRRSDCSNKAILYASLLEQIGEDYLLLYMPQHIAVAVRKGRFTDGNDLAFSWEGDTWLFAETTATGFKIGIDRLTRSFGFEDVRYVQRPRERDRIVSPHTGKVLVFR